MRATTCTAHAALLLVLCAGSGRAGGEAEARAVIDRAIKAHGGADELAKLDRLTFTLKGKCYGTCPTGAAFTARWSVQDPDKLRQEVDIAVAGKTLKVVRVINGGAGWVQMAGTTREMGREALAERKEGLYANRVARLVPLSGPEFRLTPLGAAVAGGRAAVGVRVAQAGHRDVSLFFDKQTGLLLKSQRRAKDPTDGKKEFTQEMCFGGYKAVGGVPHAHTIAILRDGKKYAEAACSDFKTHEKLDDAVFARPAIVASK